IIGIFASILLITQLGTLSIVFSIGLIVLGFLWYWYYSRNRVARTGAIYHMFERLGQQRYEGLDSELRGILKEKGLRKEDPFEDIVTFGRFIEIDIHKEFEEVVDNIAQYLETVLPLRKSEIVNQIMEGTKIGATPVTHGFALPHFRVEGIEKAEMVIVRAKRGVSIDIFNPLTHEAEETRDVKGLFFLVSPENNPTQHLRLLAKIAERLDDDQFIEKWDSAKNENELKNALLFDEEFFTLNVSYEDKTNILIGAQIKTLEIPQNCLIATIRRTGKTIIPKGNTELREGDHLVFIGDSEGIKELRKQYHN
ncbi:MAG: PTS sugar transporter subunit IIA, partial [Melioribacteraceae bacterium]|nr:PTS sugar transporter subunit IIA [Melioribacteraceae bacterium]